ncbi:insulinase family protein, partial [bacterium]
MGIIILFAWERIILDNGLTVIYEQDTTFPVVSVQLWYRVGSVYEYPGITGISHLLEHMMFRKTKNLDYGEYGERVRELGGEYNGATSYDYTFYYINIAKDRWEEALKLESERMQNLVVDSADFERERKVVLEEYLRGISNPLGKFYREFNYLLYLNHPYRQPIIGYRSDIENISWGEVYEHYEKFYSPSNAVLVIVGDVERNEMLEAVKEYFGHI